MRGPTDTVISRARTRQAAPRGIVLAFADRSLSLFAVGLLKEVGCDKAAEAAAGTPLKRLDRVDPPSDKLSITVPPCRNIAGTLWPAAHTFSRASSTDAGRFSRQHSGVSAFESRSGKCAATIRSTSWRLSCSPTIGIPSGRCRAAMHDTRCAGCESKRNSPRPGWRPEGAKQVSLPRDPRTGSAACGRSGIGSTRSETRPISSVASTMCTGIHESISLSRASANGSGLPFTDLCTAANMTGIGGLRTRLRVGTIRNGARRGRFAKRRENGVPAAALRPCHTLLCAPLALSAPQLRPCGSSRGLA
jgi:hypothetical protein